MSVHITAYHRYSKLQISDKKLYCCHVYACRSSTVYLTLQVFQKPLLLIVKMDLWFAPILEELTKRLAWRSADEIGQAKQNHSSKDRISDWRCICGNNSIFPVHQDKTRECLEYKCVIALSLACHGSSKYLNQIIGGIIGNLWLCLPWGSLLLVTVCFQLIVLFCY